MDHSVLKDLRAVFSGRLLTDDADMAVVLNDRGGQWGRCAIAFAEPDTADDVAAILRFCESHDMPVVSHGGSAGLVDANLPNRVRGALFLSLSRLDRIRAIHQFDLTMTVEAGCTLRQIREAALEAGMLFPLRLASGDGCTIGDKLATNANGLQMLRFGSARELCLGLEVITPQGDLWDGLHWPCKDMPGYDLRNLYIGSEGRLGVITAAVLKMQPMPAASVVAIVAVPSPQAALSLFVLARQWLDASLSAFELMSGVSLDQVLPILLDAQRPLQSNSAWHVLLEASGMWGEHEAAEIMESVLAEALDDRLVTDAAVSSSPGQFTALWALRESIGQAKAVGNGNTGQAVFLPMSALSRFIERGGEAVLDRIVRSCPVVFGHMGRGACTEIEHRLNQLIYDTVAPPVGSIIAEHGFGLSTRDTAAHSQLDVERKLLRTLKDALDPKGLMNPGRLPSQGPPGKIGAVLDLKCASGESKHIDLR